MEKFEIEEIIKIKDVAGKSLSLKELSESLCPIIKEVVPFELFTIIAINSDDSFHRLFSNNSNYKPDLTRSTPTKAWADQVIHRKEVCLIENFEAMRKIYIEPEKILELGYDCALNAPIIHRNKAIGAINILASGEIYTTQHARFLACFTPYFVPFILGNDL